MLHYMYVCVYVLSAYANKCLCLSSQQQNETLFATIWFVS